jgi:plastocyanin
MREARRRWAVGCAMAMALTGCAPPAAPPAVAQKAPQKTTQKEQIRADCTRATKVVISADGSAFSPAGLTIQRGAFLAITNKSAAPRPLRSTPDASIVTSTIDVKERQVIQFPQAGAFTVRAGEALLHLTVAGESGCGAPEPTLTITGAGRFTPATAHVTATENFAVVNDSGVAQSVSCSPGGNTDHTRLDAGETQILAIDEPGRYVCASRQHPAVRVTVTVTAA